MSKDKRLAWAYSILSEHVKKDSFGTITIIMNCGTISLLKEDIHHKPPIDDKDLIP